MVIIKDLPAEQKCQIWEQSVEIVRRGSKPIVINGVTHEPRTLQVPLAASLLVNGELTSPEIQVPCPIPHVAVEVADLLHDPRVAMAYGLIDAIVSDIITGKLVPISTEVQEQAEP